MGRKRGLWGIAAVGVFLLAVPAQAAPARASRPQTILAAKAARDSAYAGWLRERWSGTFAGLRRARASFDDASSRYRSVLLEDALPAVIPAREREAWTEVALDLAEEGAWPRAHRLLSGPLGSPASLRAVQALAAARAGKPTAGLQTLGWPDSRARTAKLDEASLFVAATLSDSAGLARAGRAARWRLATEGRAPTARGWARGSLVRSLASSGQPLLAKEILARASSRTNQETLFLADLTATTGDTLGAARLLVPIATRSDNLTADRHAAGRRAAALLMGAAADSLGEKEWMGLLRALADVGESDRALRLMDRRKRPAPDPGAQADREDLKASLLYRAKRYEASATAYKAILARPGRTPAQRADPALGLARALRNLDRFQPSDSAFVLAASLDTAGTVRENAAWERAREWEDDKSPREAAAILKWARARVRTESLGSTVRVHEALAWIRADSLAQADSVLGTPGPEDVRVHFWRGWVAAARGDSARALASYRRAWELDPWSYEGVRARELSGMRVEATQGSPAGAHARHVNRRRTPPPQEARASYAVGFRDYALETLRACATGEIEPKANGCIDALEEEGVFRVGRASLDLDLRLRFPPAYAGPVFLAADEESLSAPFVWSIMRLESGYSPTARSRAGALGLLQLIVPTASRLARHPVTEDSLLVPDLNVRLGAMYLRQLAREFGDLRPVAASYNAGEEPVRRWIAARPRIDDLWVELIPYWETRGYVKQTYAAMRRYEAVYEATPSR